MIMMVTMGLVCDYPLVAVFWNQHAIHGSGILPSSFIHCNIMTETENNNNNSDRTMPNQQHNNITWMPTALVVLTLGGKMEACNALNQTNDEM